MDKKKQKPNNKPDKQPIAPQIIDSRDDPLAKILVEFKTDMEILAKNDNDIKEVLSKLAEATRKNENRINAVAKGTPEGAGKINPLEIFKMITDVLNSAPIKMLIEKFVGSEETVLPPAEAPISDTERTYLLGVKKANDALQNRWFEAMVRGNEADTEKKLKEAGADW